MRALRFPALRITFNLRSLSARGLGLAIEHLPCCLLTVAAASIGIPFLSHNAGLELGFAIGGAFIGEYVGHKYIFNRRCADHAHSESRQVTARRYAIALAIGLTTWGAHQLIFHDHEPATKSAQVKSGQAQPAPRPSSP